MLQRSPTYIVSLPARGPDRRAAAPGARATARPTRSCAGRTSLSTMLTYQLSRRRPRAGEEAASGAASQRQLPAGYDVDTHFKPALQPLGPAPVPRARRRPVRARSRDGSAVDRHRPDRALHRDRDRAASRARAGGRHDRHRHRPNLLLLGGIELERRRRAGRACSTGITYKGMMLSGVPNLAFTSATRTPPGR